MKFVVLFLAVAGVIPAQEIAGRWTATADTVDASGVRRRLPQTLEIKFEDGKYTGLLVSRRGTGGIPLRVIQEGTLYTLLGDLDFEGGEHLRWYLESWGGVLKGKVWAVHDSPKKWGVDWTGPVEFVREKTK